MKNILIVTFSILTCAAAFSNEDNQQATNDPRTPEKVETKDSDAQEPARLAPKRKADAPLRNHKPTVRRKLEMPTLEESAEIEKEDHDLEMEIEANLLVIQAIEILAERDRTHAGNACGRFDSVRPFFNF